MVGMATDFELLMKYTEKKNRKIDKNILLVIN